MFTYKDYITTNNYTKFQELAQEILFTVQPANLNEWETLAKLGEMADVNKNHIEVIYLSDDELAVLVNRDFLPCVYDELYVRNLDRQREKDYIENFVLEDQEAQTRCM